MKTRDWKDIAELIGIAAIVASLIFVGLQMRQDQSIAIADTRSALTESAQSIAELIQDNPDLWKRGLDRDELNGNEEVEFLAMARVVHQLHFNHWLRFERFGHRDPARIERRYAYALYVHPGLRNAFVRYREWEKFRIEAYGMPSQASFDDGVEANLKQLDEDGPPLPNRKEYIFW